MGSKIIESLKSETYEIKVEKIESEQYIYLTITAGNKECFIMFLGYGSIMVAVIDNENDDITLEKNYQSDDHNVLVKVIDVIIDNTFTASFE